MKRFLRILLSIVLLLFAIYFLLIDHVLKALIEREGSKALAARLDVGKVVFHLIPTSIRLESVQATNPREPMRNLVEFAALETPLQLGALFERRIEIPELRIEGLRFDTQRERSGAIAGLTPLPATSTIDPVPPDTAQIALQQQQRLRDEVDHTRQDMAALLAKWQQRLQQLPDDARVADYQARAQALRAGNKTAELEQLRAQVRGELARAQQWKEDFELDLQNARAQLAYARSAPLSAGTAGATPQAMNDLVSSLLGSEFKPQLDAAGARLDQFVRQADAAGALALLVRRANVSGQLDFGSQPLLFAGTVDNLTPQPRHWNVVTEFALDGLPTQPGHFNARGRIDVRQTPRIDVRIDLRQFPLRDFALSRNPQLGITVQSAAAEVQGLLSSTGNQFDLNLVGRFEQASVVARGATEAASHALKEALQGLTEFDVSLQASGAMHEPTLRFDSSLMPRMAGALSQQLQIGGGPQAEQLNPELREQLDNVQQLVADFETLRQQLLTRQAVLQGIVAP